jgi:hypothetical protein
MLGRWNKKGKDEGKDKGFERRRIHREKHGAVCMELEA